MARAGSWEGARDKVEVHRVRTCGDGEREGCARRNGWGGGGGEVRVPE